MKRPANLILRLPLLAVLALAYCCSLRAGEGVEPPILSVSRTDSVRSQPNFRYAKAVWISAGLGIGNARDNRRSRSNATDCQLLDISGHFRREWLVISGGYQQTWPYEDQMIIHTFYLLFGKSFHRWNGEAGISIGASVNRWRAHTESARGVVESSLYFGMQGKAHILVHFPQLVGLGMSVEGNLNREVSYYAFALTLSLGYWFGKKSR